jgi:hypothetical protein
MSIADDQIDDSDIGPLWAEHFSRIGEDSGSKVIVLSLVYIIEDKAKTAADADNWPDRVSRELRKHGIPPDEFSEIQGASSR